MAALDLLLSLSIPALIILHLLVAPYTKVEESFNIQATHDILVYGTPTSDIRERLAQYDHFDFPGAVPRTFVGPVLLAGLGQPVIALVGFRHAQLVVRGVLGLANAAALLVFKANVERAFGRNVARWYALLQATQFHVLFYASRTLPNMFAFGLTTLAFAQLLPHPDPKKQVRRFRLAIALLTCATAVFRSELAILLVAVSLHGLTASLIPLRKILPPFLFSFAFSLAVSVPLDSYFWQPREPLSIVWPELWGFYYNAVLGSSSAWGVSPWHWYFTAALPRILTNPVVSTVLLPLALLTTDGTKEKARRVALPPLAFVALYSLQPHKEARFIFYVAPPLTAAAALAADYVWTRRAKGKGKGKGKSVVSVRVRRRLVAGGVALSVPLSFVISLAMLAASSLNYPGGEALDALRGLATATATTNDIAESSMSPSPSAPDLGGTVVVHTDVLACMTGVTLFGQHPSLPSYSRGVLQTTATGGGGGGGEDVTFTFDKTEDPAALRNPAFWERFDYVLAEDPKAVGGGPWEVVGVVEGLAGVEFEKPKAKEDMESGDGKDYRIFGRGQLVRRVKDQVKGLTGGWWIGPRMVPKVHILRRMREGEGRKAVAE